MENICIIIPAYNEERRISRTLEKFVKFFDEKKRSKEIQNYEVLVVLNNCKDKTSDVVRKHQKKSSRIFCLDFEQGGKGFAIMEGFKDALKRRFTLIGFVDADLSTSPEAFFDLIKHIGKADGIIASRYLEGSVISKKQSMTRIFASRIFNLSIIILLGLRYKDTQCGAKLFRANCLRKIVPKVTLSGWAFDVDLLYAAKKGGCKIKEFPTKWEDRDGSKINFFSAGPRMFFAIVRLRLLNSRFKSLVRTYERLG